MNNSHSNSNDDDVICISSDDEKDNQSTPLRNVKEVEDSSRTNSNNQNIIILSDVKIQSTSNTSTNNNLTIVETTSLPADNFIEPDENHLPVSLQNTSVNDGSGPESTNKETNRSTKYKRIRRSNSSSSESQDDERDKVTKNLKKRRVVDSSESSATTSSASEDANVKARIEKFRSVIELLSETYNSVDDDVIIEEMKKIIPEPEYIKLISFLIKCYQTNVLNTSSQCLPSSTNVMKNFIKDTLQEKLENHEARSEKSQEFNKYSSSVEGNLSDVESVKSFTSKNESNPKSENVKTTARKRGNMELLIPQDNYDDSAQFNPTAEDSLNSFSSDDVEIVEYNPITDQNSQLSSSDDDLPIFRFITKENILSSRIVLERMSDKQLKPYLKNKETQNVTTEKKEDSGSTSESYKTCSENESDDESFGNEAYSEDRVKRDASNQSEKAISKNFVEQKNQNDGTAHENETGENGPTEENSNDYFDGNKTKEDDPLSIHDSERKDTHSSSNEQPHLVVLNPLSKEPEDLYSIPLKSSNIPQEALIETSNQVQKQEISKSLCIDDIPEVLETVEQKKEHGALNQNVRACNNILNNNLPENSNPVPSTSTSNPVQIQETLNNLCIDNNPEVSKITEQHKEHEAQNQKEHEAQNQKEYEAQNQNDKAPSDISDNEEEDMIRPNRCIIDEHSSSSIELIEKEIEIINLDDFEDSQDVNTENGTRHFVVSIPNSSLVDTKKNIANSVPTSVKEEKLSDIDKPLVPPQKISDSENNKNHVQNGATDLKPQLPSHNEQFDDKTKEPALTQVKNCKTNENLQKIDSDAKSIQVKNSEFISATIDELLSRNPEMTFADRDKAELSLRSQLETQINGQSSPSLIVQQTKSDKPTESRTENNSISDDSVVSGIASASTTSVVPNNNPLIPSVKTHQSATLSASNSSIDTQQASSSSDPPIALPRFSAPLNFNLVASTSFDIAPTVSVSSTTTPTTSQSTRRFSVCAENPKNLKNNANSSKSQPKNVKIVSGTKDQSRITKALESCLSTVGNKMPMHKQIKLLPKTTQSRPTATVTPSQKNSLNDIESMIPQNVISPPASNAVASINPAQQNNPLCTTIQLRPWLNVKSLKLKNVITSMLNVESLRKLFKCMNEFCDFCTDNEAEFRKHLTQHLASSQGLMLFDCPYCVHANFQIDFLVNHIKSRHGDCKYICLNCFYRTPIAYNIEQHFKIHEKNGVMRILLNRDVMTVPDDAQFNDIKFVEFDKIKCPVTSCDVEVSTLSQFDLHFKQHGNIKEIVCTKCNSNYTNEHFLGHFLKCNKLYNYHCCYCLHGFENLDAISNHLVIFHMEKVPFYFERVDTSHLTTLEMKKACCIRKFTNNAIGSLKI